MAASAILAGLVCAPAWALEIVKDGRPQAAIVIPQDAAIYRKWAAGWLQEYVEKATGAKLEIVSETEAPAGTLISVGHTKLSEEAGIRTDDLKWDGCKLVVRGKVLFLVGRDKDPLRPLRTPHSLNRDCAQGTVRSVAMFLEDFVGVRWFIASSEGTVVPPSTDVSVPDTLDRTFVPFLAYTDLWSPYTPIIGSIANNHRMSIKRKSYGGHTWPAVVSGAKYLKDHPDYFRMDANGNRSATHGHLCTSNRKVWEILRDQMRADFDAGYDVVQLGQSDGWQPCLCPECIKQYGERHAITPDNPCRRVWRMHQWIIDECKKSHPDKMITVMIYGPTGWPPKDWDRLRDNVIGEMAPMTPDRVEAWRGKTAGLTNWVYWYFAMFTPRTSPQFLQEKFREFRDQMLVGVWGGPIGSWGLGGPAHYAFYRLAGDPDIDVDELVEDYCLGIYGTAGKTMKRFFDLFHNRSSQWLPMRTHLYRLRDSYPAEGTIVALFPPKVTHRLHGLLLSAERTAESDRAKGWLRSARDEFDGLRYLSDMLVHKRALEARPSRVSVHAVRESVEAFDVWRAKFLTSDASLARTWCPGRRFMSAYLLSDGLNQNFIRLISSRHSFLRQTIEEIRRGQKSARGRGIGSPTVWRGEILAPLTWDFDKIEANLGREQAQKRITAKRTSRRPRIDGVIDAAEWADTVPQGFERFRSPGSTIPSGATTHVRVMYDDENLYAAYECREPRVESMTLKKVNRDGRVYGNDEVELLLNPDCSDDKFMQFEASPVEGAFFDARRGYITDVLHPQYNQLDRTWNPDWRYGFTVDKEKKRWAVEMAIPFRSLGASPPKPGTVWTGNFARCRRADGQELTCWAAETFGQPELFGEIVFDGRTTAAEPTPRKDPAQTSPAKIKPVKPRTDESATNFFRNGGFEELTADGKPVAWSISSFPKRGVQELLQHCTVTTDRAHSGERSLCIDLTKLDLSKATAAGAGHVILYNMSAADAAKQLRGKELVFSAWLYYGLLPDDTRAHNAPGPWLEIQVTNKKGLIKGAGTRINCTRKGLAALGYVAASQLNSKWVKVEKKMVVPVDAERMWLRGGMPIQLAGTKQLNAVSVCIDDVRLDTSPRPRGDFSAGARP